MDALTLFRLFLSRLLSLGLNKMNEKWTLISPDGDAWEGDSPISCCGKALRCSNKDLTDQEQLRNLFDGVGMTVEADAIDNGHNELIGTALLALLDSTDE